MLQIYFVRITPSGDHPSIELFLNSLSSKWVYGSETSKKHKFHYHAVLESSLTSRELSSEITKYFKDSVPAGNGGRSIQLSDSEERSIQYTIKDNNYRYKGYTENFIQTCYVNSFQKLEFNDSLKSISKQYLEDVNYELEQLINDVVTIYNQCNRTVIPHVIETRCLSLFLKKSSNNRKNFSKQIANNIYKRCDVDIYSNNATFNIQEFDSSALEF